MCIVSAVLLETVSIQKYVYASNRLVENIGASNIVTKMYKEEIKTAVKSALGWEVDIDIWRADPRNILICRGDTDFEVGYIGGGNALLFFKEHDKAKRFVKNWTRNLLVKAPGLNVAIALEPGFNINNFQGQLTDLFKMLRKNKSTYLPQTFVSKHGITADCPHSGLTAEVFYQPPGDMGGYISSASKAKLDQVNASVLCHDSYALTTDIEILGQIDGRDHIAIVYIDGNSLGEKFRACKTLSELRQLSISMDNAMKEVYEEFTNYVISHMQYFTMDDSGFCIQQSNDGKAVLPFRPLLMEGDDITFITDGRLGVPFAKKYLELMSKKKLLNGAKEYQLSAAAGVAITKTKYPFFRGYVLAEQLCQVAKEKARKEPGTSWLDFHVAYGGFSGNIGEIRQDKYTVKQGRLNFGPYLISDTKDEEKSIVHLINGIKQFTDNKKWSRNNVKEFRTVLTLGQQATEHFLAQMDKKDKKAYNIKGKEYHKTGWKDEKTPYFDMIELMEFYPGIFLNSKEVQ